MRVMFANFTMSLILKFLTTSILLAGFSLAGFYDTNKNVFEVTALNFNDVVYNTNYTTIVEFYAPWCGHCQNLKPIYKKVGAASEGIFQVAAMDCDNSENKAFCAGMQVKGYPTLMVFRPPKYDPYDPLKNAEIASKQKHASEVYNGERSLIAIVDFVTSRIKNYVKRISNEELLGKFIKGRTKTNKNKALLLTDKNKPFPLIKSIAIDYMADLELAYATINKKNKQLFFEKLGLDTNSKVPQMVVIDKSSEVDEVSKFEGNFDKESLSSFLTLFGTPQEGPNSKREKVLARYRSPHKKASKKTKKNSSKKLNKAKAKTQDHDEL